MTDLDDAVSRVLTAQFRAGLFEHPYVDEERAATEVGNKANIPLARQAADGLSYYCKIRPTSCLSTHRRSRLLR